MAVSFHCTGEDVEWAGLTCSEEEPCPVYLEISAVESAGNKVFVAGNIHSATVTLYSELLASDDGGSTWREAHDRIRGAGLDHIQFIDAENGWATGALLYPLAQDPFVLVTADGGRTWQRRPIFRDDGEAGSVQQIYFTTKAQGTLIIDRGRMEGKDRYERYESDDGGVTWSLKQESDKLLSLKPAGTADWTVRADGPTQSFVIEKRAGQQWTRVAAFAVKLDACKTPPR